MTKATHFKFTSKISKPTLRKMMKNNWWRKLKKIPKDM